MVGNVITDCVPMTEKQLLTEGGYTTGRAGPSRAGTLQSRHDKPFSSLRTLRSQDGKGVKGKDCVILANNNVSSVDQWD